MFQPNNSTRHCFEGTLEPHASLSFTQYDCDWTTLFCRMGRPCKTSVLLTPDVEGLFFTLWMASWLTLWNKRGWHNWTEPWMTRHRLTNTPKFGLLSQEWEKLNLSESFIPGASATFWQGRLSQWWIQLGAFVAWFLMFLLLFSSPELYTIN